MLFWHISVLPLVFLCDRLEHNCGLEICGRKAASSESNFSPILILTVQSHRMCLENLVCLSFMNLVLAIVYFT
jgi:hypothetical protein